MERRAWLHCLLLALIVLVAMALLLLAHQPAGAQGVSPPAQTPGQDRGERVVEFARGQIGTRYIWGGIRPGGGFDCSGLVWWAYRQVGVQLPRTAAAQARSTLVERIKAEEHRAGDLVFFANTYQAGVSHVGVYTQDNHMVHANSRGVREDNLGTPYWREHFAGAGTVRPR